MNKQEEISLDLCAGGSQISGAAIHILYLASGNSKRFGENKLLYSFQGKPLYRWGLDTLKQYVPAHAGMNADKTVDAEVRYTLTVVSRYEEIRSFAEELGIRSVDSPDSEKGISHTIKAGLRSLGEISPEDFVVFVVADQPFLAADSLDRLLACAKEGTETASMACGDRPGNPTLFSAKLVPELMALEGDKGGRAVIRKHDCIFVQVGSEKELDDIDVKSDL